MTLAVVFRRRVADRYELVFGSDSRLTGGQTNDQAQKIFQLPRSDALFAFAGDTQYAYPLLMQMLRSIESFPPSADGRLRLSKAKGHILKVFQQSYASIHSLPFGQKYPEDPDNFFLLGGYDWVSSAFRTWLLSFDAEQRTFVFRSIRGRFISSAMTKKLDHTLLTKQAASCGSVRKPPETLITSRWKS
jgi:hypothetical protein